MKGRDPQGATGATGDINLNSSSCASSEQSSAKKAQKSSNFTNRKQPKGMKLAIDIVSINN